MQRRIARANGRRDALAPWAVRIGIAVGEATEDTEGVHGLVVVEAARLCAAARGGQILATALVETLCAGRGDHRPRAEGGCRPRCRRSRWFGTANRRLGRFLFRLPWPP